MTNLALDPSRPGGAPARALARELAYGAGYWAIFLLALEPGNVMGAADAGHPLALGPEAARIAAASLLGAPTAPLVLAIVRRFPIEGDRWRRRSALHAAAVAGLVLVLIPLSCLLATIPIGGARIGDPDVMSELAANGLLLAFGVAGLSGIAHAVHFRTRRKVREPTPAPAHLTQVPVRSRGGVTLVRLDEVDWIETQGNYLALHAGPATHLIRETAARLETRLDPQRFVRIHRRALVAVDRVRALAPLGGGDAELTLADGSKLRLSRSFREHVQARLEAERSGG